VETYLVTAWNCRSPVRPCSGSWQAPPSVWGGAAWWQRDERGLEGDVPARPHVHLPLPPPPTHTWVAIHTYDTTAVVRHASQVRYDLFTERVTNGNHIVGTIWRRCF